MESIQIEISKKDLERIFISLEYQIQENLINDALEESYVGELKDYIEEIMYLYFETEE